MSKGPFFIHVQGASVYARSAAAGKGAREALAGKLGQLCLPWRSWARNSAQRAGERPGVQLGYMISERTAGTAGMFPRGVPET